MTPAERIAAIRARVEAMMPAAWEYDDGEMYRVLGEDWRDTMLCYRYVLAPGMEAMFRSHADAEFIAAARQDVPYLLDRIERLEGALRKIEAWSLGEQLAEHETIGSIAWYALSGEDE